jgi:hypothetical protein
MAFENSPIAFTKRTSDKEFSTLFSVILCALSLYFLLKDKIALSLIFFVLLITLQILRYKNKIVLQKLNSGWQKFGIFLGLLTNPILLGGIFLFIITPVALLGRLFKRDQLGLRYSPVKSYWITRLISNNKIGDFRNQF